jgi:hypothetical protein
MNWVASLLKTLTVEIQCLPVYTFTSFGIA